MKSKNYLGYIVRDDGTLYCKKSDNLKVLWDNGRGYLITNLSVNGKVVVKAIHRIVAEAFIDNPKQYSDVDHIDGNRLNNHVSNLRWVTHGENIKHSYTLKNRSAVGTANARCKSSEADVVEICELLSSGMMPAKIRDLYNHDYALIRNIKRKSTWRHISDNYNW